MAYNRYPGLQNPYLQDSASFGNMGGGAAPFYSNPQAFAGGGATMPSRAMAITNPSGPVTGGPIAPGTPELADFAGAAAMAPRANLATQAATEAGNLIQTGKGAMTAADTLSNTAGMADTATGMMGMWGGAFPYVLGTSMLMDMVKGFGKKGGGGGSLTMPLMTLGLLSGGMFGK